ncbi:hypothetical protein DESA109040_09085 [Deinococcus saxicola]|uniref:hypothetical protein n=1 Tax=Deinococcus saxicola TaxID=249406 RepID=UPI0039F1394E
MAQLDFAVSMAVEKVLRMGDGRVLELSNNTFANLFHNSIGVEIYSDQYSLEGDSKAKRFRSFLKIAKHVEIAKILLELSKTGDYKKSAEDFPQEKITIAEYIDKSSRIGLMSGLETEALASSVENHSEIINQIRAAILSNQIQSSMDRLHTLVYGYLKSICSEVSIDILHPNGSGKSVESLIGEYIKYVRTKDIISSYLDGLFNSLNHRFKSLNDVRNSGSLAHVNPLLSNEEAENLLGAIASDLKLLTFAHSRIVEENP